MTVSILILALLAWAQPSTLEREAEIVAIGMAVEYHAPRHGRDPWTIAALAVKESGLRNDVVGKLGECGALQVLGKYLRPRMSCAELAIPDGGVLGALRALDQWEAWADARGLHDGAVWDCYAAGHRCAKKKTSRPWPATRRLFRKDAELRAIGAGIAAARSVTR